MYKITEYLFQELNTNHQNAIVHSVVREFEANALRSGLSIKIPINGVEHYTIDGRTYPIGSGQFLLTNKGEKVGCCVHSKEEIEGYCIYLDPANYKDVIDTIESKGGLDKEASPSMPTVYSGEYYFDSSDFCQFLQHLTIKENAQSLQEEDYLLLTEKLVWHQLEKNKQLKSIKAYQLETRKELLKRVNLARTYIFDNYDKAVSLDDLSKIAYLSKYHLLRTFKEVYHRTPYQVLLNRRIQKAKEFLAQKIEIGEVAHLCGFADRRSFSRAFKKITNSSPSHYRNK